MKKLNGTYEVVFVDDGSKEDSLQKLESLHRIFEDIVVVSLAEHTSKTETLQAGFDIALGEIYITMDADGQDDPTDIPKLLDKLSQGYDVVYGWRYQRQDNVRKKAASFFANIVRRVLTRDNIHDVGCALRVFRKKDIREIRLSGGLHRFFSFIMRKKGYRVAEVKVISHRRTKGASKYGLWGRLKEGTIDLFRIMFLDTDKLLSCEQIYKIKTMLRKPPRVRSTKVTA
jgi:glycosyltransferase involved in cell wall biosynthesis